jgi:flagellar basal body-associated protein FliL
MTKDNFFCKVYHLYYDGFRSMTLGRTLWVIILIKLFVIFVVLKLFFFPDFLKQHAEEGHEAEFVATQVLDIEHCARPNGALATEGTQEH